MINGVEICQFQEKTTESFNVLRLYYAGDSVAIQVESLVKRPEWMGYFASITLRREQLVKLIGWLEQVSVGDDGGSMSEVKACRIP